MFSWPSLNPLLTTLVLLGIKRKEEKEKKQREKEAEEEQVKAEAEEDEEPEYEEGYEEQWDEDAEDWEEWNCLNLVDVERQPQQRLFCWSRLYIRMCYINTFRFWCL